MASRKGNNKIGQIARAKATALLESPEYVASCQRRIKCDTLPGSVEQMLWHYAYGKPVERIEVDLPKERMDEWADEELVLERETLAREILVSTKADPKSDTSVN